VTRINKTDSESSFAPSQFCNLAGTARPPVKIEITAITPFLNSSLVARGVIRGQALASFSLEPHRPPSNPASGVQHSNLHHR
jgi:hypothetical protein